MRGPRAPRMPCPSRASPSPSPSRAFPAPVPLVSPHQGHGFSYWIPLEFDAQGNVLPFAPFVDSFTLDVLVAETAVQAVPVEPTVEGAPGLSSAGALP
jgi:hypothetical protein